MKKELFYALAAGLLGASCTNTGPREVEYFALASDRMINQLSDSSFFNSVLCILDYDGDIYLSDTKRCQIFRLDTALNLVATIGKEGHGPKEFGYVEQFVVCRDTIFAGDITKQRILRFSTDGAFCGEEALKELIPLNQRIGMNPDHIYYLNTVGDKSGTSVLADYDRRSEQLNWFGRITDFGYPGKTRLQNRRNVHCWNGHLVVVPLSIPSIEIYDAKSRALEQSVDISQIPLVQAMYQKGVNNRQIAESPSGGYAIFFDSYLCGDALYVLCNVDLEGSELDHSAMLEFDLSKGGAEWVRRYDFPDWVCRFCVTDDYIYGFVPEFSAIKRYPRL